MVDRRRQTPLQMPRPFSSVVGLRAKKARKAVENTVRDRLSSDLLPADGNLPEAVVIGHRKKKKVGGVEVKNTKRKNNKRKPSKGSTVARPSASSYTVQRGDSLSKIAKKHGMSLKELIELNPQITNPDIIYVGDAVRLRSSSTSNSSKNSTKAKARPTTVMAEESPVEVQVPDVNPDEVVRSLIGPQPVNVAPVYPNYNPYQMPGPDIRNYMDAPVSRGVPDYNQLMG